jgi:hypothetical protein
MFFLFSVFLLRGYKKYFQAEKKPFLYLLTPYLLIILLRLPMYTKVHDDLTYYLIAGEYTKNLWTNHHFLPTYAIYFYNALPLFYNFFIDLMGLRITLFISMFSLSLWMVSLNLRFKTLLKNKLQKILLDFFFISFPFWPHLMAIHGTFMADFFALVFFLETFYQFVSNNKDKTLAFICLLVTGLVKQSSIFYAAPIFIYLLIKNFKKINLFIAIPLVLFFSSYFIRLYFEVGNPILGGLYNNIFQSPIVDDRAGGAGLEAIFGGRNLWEKLVWPVWGQFSGRFGEGFVGKYAKFYFSIFMIFSFLGSLYFLIKSKQRWLFLSIILSYYLWSFDLGYSRWVIPTLSAGYLASLLYISKKLNLSFFEKYKKIIYLFVIILSLSSIKTDFGWRPYHNPKFLLSYYYFPSFKYIFADRYQDINRVYQNDFQDTETISVVRSEKAFFYGFLGAINGKKVIHSADEHYYNRVLNGGDKISERVKNNLKTILRSKQVLVVFDTLQGNTQLLKKDYFLNNQQYRCRKLDNAKPMNIIQNIQMETIVRYQCERI